MLSYHNGFFWYYPLVNMENLAALFDVYVTELLDDFNMFLYNDRGKQIRAKRLVLHMTQREYADMLGVHVGKAHGNFSHVRAKDGGFDDDKLLSFELNMDTVYVKL